MAYAYKHLNANDKAEIDKRVPEAAPPAVDDRLLAAWERDHYAHSRLAEASMGADKRQEHLDAMTTIEAAIAAQGQ